MIYKENIIIPDEEINKLMDTLDLSEEEAIETWLFDNDLMENEEEAKLTAKAKDNRITATIHDAKKETTKKRMRKNVEVADVDKEKIIAEVAKALQGLGIDAVITNKTKIVEFEYNGDCFKLDLIRRRKK